MSFRVKYLVLGTILVLIALLLSDPDSGIIQQLPVGSGVISTILILATSILYVGFLHISRKGLLDYVNLQTLFNKAKEESTGAGLAIIGVGLMMISIAIVITAATM